MTTPQDIIRAWCASCGMAEPSNGDVGALLSLLFPAMPVTQALGEAPVAEVADAITAFLEAQDALDNRELQGINGEDYYVLMRRRSRARDDLDAALAKGAAS